MANTAKEKEEFLMRAVGWWCFRKQSRSYWLRSSLCFAKLLYKTLMYILFGTGQTLIMETRSKVYLGKFHKPFGASLDIKNQRIWI